MSVSNFKFYQAIGTGNHKSYLMPACDYTYTAPQIKALPENFLDVVYQEYYVPESFQSGVNARTLEDGQKDVISMLYNDDEVTNVSSTDPYNIVVREDGGSSDSSGSLKELKMVIPTNM